MTSLSSEGSGPTGQTFVIRTVADFLLVPEERLGECLREFRVMLDMAHAAGRLVDAVGEEMQREGIGGYTPGDVRWTVDEFEWIDDDKGNVSLSLGVEESANSKSSRSAPTETRGET